MPTSRTSTFERCTEQGAARDCACASPVAPEYDSVIEELRARLPWLSPALPPRVGPSPGLLRATHDRLHLARQPWWTATLPKVAVGGDVELSPGESGVERGGRSAARSASHIRVPSIEELAVISRPLEHLAYSRRGSGTHPLKGVSRPHPVLAGEPIVRYALNTPKLYEYEGRSSESPPPGGYGDAQAILDDLYRLGVEVARHPNVLQLLPQGIDWGTELGGIPVDDTGSRYTDTIGADPMATWWGDLFSRLASYPTGAPKIDVTLLSLGGGTAAMGDEAFETLLNRLRASGFLASTVDLATMLATAQSLASTGAPTGMTWDTAFLGTVDASGNTFDTDPAVRDYQLWDLGVLDVTNAHKRGVLQAIASGFLDMLETQATALGFRPEDFIDAIEIGNEVDVRNLDLLPDIDGDGVDDWYGDGAGWGTLIAPIAYEIRTRFPRIKIKLPALASNAEDFADSSKWAAKIAFLGNLLTAFGDGILAIDPSADPAAYVDGIDLHYYHRYGVDKKHGYPRGDIQPIAFLMRDVQDVKDLAGVGVYAFPELQVSVIESATSAYCDDTSDTWTEAYDSGCEASASADYPEFTAALDPPREDYRPGDVGANDFQAIALWARFAAAGAAGASVVGWHTLMAPFDDAGFAGTGLRRDRHLETQSAQAALERPSWWAFRRFLRRLGSAYEVQAVYPVIDLWPSHADLQAAFDAGTEGNDLYAWAVTYALAEPVLIDHVERSFALLLFVDPWGPVETADFTVSTALGGWDDIVEDATRPWAVVHNDGTRTSTSTMPLPDAWWLVAPASPVVLTGPGVFTASVTRGQYPRLFFSKRPLVPTLDGVA